MRRFNVGKKKSGKRFTFYKWFCDTFEAQIGFSASPAKNAKPINDSKLHLEIFMVLLASKLFVQAVPSAIAA